MMTRKERVKRAVEHQEADIVPYYVRFSSAHDRIAEFLGDEEFEDHFGNHFTYYRTIPPRERLPSGDFKDEFGVLHILTDEGTWFPEERALVTEETVETYPFPDPNDPRRFSALEPFLVDRKEWFNFHDMGRTLFERAYDLRGYQNLLADMILNPSLVHRLFDRILEYNLALFENGLRYDFDGVRFGDDWGHQRGLIMGIKHWRTFVKPRIQELFRAVRDAGLVLILHSCGNVEELLPELIDCGLQILEPMQPEVMDVFRIKKEYGKDLAFYGGVSLQQTLAHGTPDEVEKEIVDKLQGLGKGGGYICGPSHTLTPDIPMENIVRMMDVLKNQ